MKKLSNKILAIKLNNICKQFSEDKSFDIAEVIANYCEANNINFDYTLYFKPTKIEKTDAKGNVSKLNVSDETPPTAAGISVDGNEINTVDNSKGYIKVKSKRIKKNDIDSDINQIITDCINRI